MRQLPDKIADEISTSACPQKHSMQPRWQDYEEANDAVGREKIQEIQEMKQRTWDKLQP